MTTAELMTSVCASNVRDPVELPSDMGFVRPSYLAFDVEVTNVGVRATIAARSIRAEAMFRKEPSR